MLGCILNAYRSQVMDESPVHRYLLLLLLILGACAPATTQPAVREVSLPTYVPLPTEAVDVQEALRAALTYLDNWQAQDFEAMYRMLSVNSRDVIAADAFRTLHTGIQNTMTFDSLSYEGRGLIRSGQRTAQFTYDMTFQTRLLGEISDPGRVMTLVLDRDNQWRVAWSAGDIFAELADGARVEFQANAPGRANIYDRDGEVLADMRGRMVQVYVVQSRVPDWESCRAALLDLTSTPEARLDAAFANARPDWTVLAGLIEEATYNSQREYLESVCDATFDSIATRRYMPNGSVLPHVIGFVGFPNENQVDDVVRAGFDAETIIGQAGIEATWNDVLMGTPGGRLTIINADGSRARVLAEAASDVAESLWLTIDLDFQQFVVGAIGRAYVENRTLADGSPGWGQTSPGAAAVVLDVNTGEILALVSYPYHDANAFTAYPMIGRDIAQEMQANIAEDERRPMLNRVTQGVYPTGSIFKVIDSVAVLDTGLYNANTPFVCTGVWQYEGDVRYDWWPPGHGTVNVRSAIKQSCNPFFYQAGFALNSADPYLLPEYSRRMGFGVPTGLTDLPEDAGQIPDPDLLLQLYGQRWTYSNAVNLAIGQGELEITPLQVARTYGAIANGGNLMRPQLVRERGILTQRTNVLEPEITGTFDVPQDVLDIVHAGLCDVTSANFGTASHIFRGSPLLDEEIGVCGKTGTAQAPFGADHSWFAAYAPAENPEIVVAVLVENAGDGSAVAAPITKQIMEYYFFLRE